jgi:hypothetical protein
MKHLMLIIMALGLVLSYQWIIQVEKVSAGEMSEEMKRMQEQLNNQVLSQPFSVAEEAQVKAYIEAAQRRGEVPQPYRGKYWRPGYTCANLRPYSYQEYLSCRYYYSYYGYYYR